MAETYETNDKTYLAGEDLSSAKWLFVTLETDTFVDLADAITDRAVGVLQNDPASGGAALVRKGGETKVVAAEALAVNDVVAPSTDGKAQVAVNTQIPCGIVVKAAGAADDVAVIEFFWGNIYPVVQSAHIADPAACASMTHTAGTGADGTTPSGAEYALARADLDALKSAVDANNSAIDSINAALAATGITAAA